MLNQQLLNEQLKLMHTAARRLPMIINNEPFDEINKLPIMHHTLHVSRLNKDNFFKDLKVLFDNLNLVYAEIVQNRVKEDELLAQLKLHKKQIINACTQLIKLNHTTITIFLSDDEKMRQALFEKNCQKIIKVMTIVVHDYKKIPTNTITSNESPSPSKQEEFDLELDHSATLTDAKTKYTNELQTLGMTINNLKLADPSDPKIKLLEAYHVRMTTIDDKSTENMDIGTLQLKRVNFTLKHADGRNPTIKDENLIHAKASSRPILGAILMTSAVLLALTSIALCATVKLAPIGLVGLGISLKLLTAATAMMGLGFSVGSLYYFAVKPDLTTKTDNVLTKLAANNK